MGECVGRDAFALVDDGDFNLVTFEFGFERNGFSGGSVTDRVIEEVDDDLPEAITICGDGGLLDVFF